MTQPGIVQALHPDPAKNGTRVTKSIYEAYRAALLATIPTAEEGIAFTDLSQAVTPHLPPEVLSSTSLGW